MLVHGTWVCLEGASAMYMPIVGEQTASASRGDDKVMDKIFKSAHPLLVGHSSLLQSPLVGPMERLQKVLQPLALAEEAGQKLLGIHGMCGIGKSKLAEAVYDAASQHTICRRRVFLHVGADCVTSSELSAKRCQLLKELTKRSSLPAFPSPQQEQAELRNSLASGDPILLVLDDLWSTEQLRWLLACDKSLDGPAEAVAAMPPGSRVLLTSQKKSAVSVPGHSCQAIHGLGRIYAIQLLCLAAFKQTLPPPQLAKPQLAKALAYCDGLPLALYVLGRQLHSVEPRDWQVRLLWLCRVKTYLPFQAVSIATPRMNSALQDW